MNYIHMLTKRSESNFHKLRLDLDLNCGRLYIIINFFLLPFYGLHSFQNLSTHCKRCYNKKTQIYKPKLSAKQAKTAVLDFIARIQRRYTIARFRLAEKRRILQARRNAFILSYSASARRAEYFDTKFEGMGTFKTYLQAIFQGTFMVAGTIACSIQTQTNSSNLHIMLYYCIICMHLPGQVHE